jgi:hypothetical protein
MSTRSYIGMLDDKGMVRSIYCHHDGYLEGVGKMLFEHYSDSKKINDLLDLGDISSLEAKVWADGPHTFENPQADAVVAYGRDRGEDNVQADVDTLQRFEKLTEIRYLFKESKWHIWNQGWVEINAALLIASEG